MYCSIATHCTLCSAHRVHTTPEAVPTICCGCFQIQLHIDPPRCRCSNCDTALVRSTMSFFKRCTRIPRRGATLKFTSTPGYNGDVVGGEKTVLWCVSKVFQLELKHISARSVLCGWFLLNFKSLRGFFQLESRPAILVFSCITSNQCTTLFSTTCWGN